MRIAANLELLSTIGKYKVTNYKWCALHNNVNLGKFVKFISNENYKNVFTIFINIISFTIDIIVIFLTIDVFWFFKFTLHFC